MTLHSRATEGGTEIPEISDAYPMLAKAIACNDVATTPMVVCTDTAAGEPLVWVRPV